MDATVAFKGIHPAGEPDRVWLQAVFFSSERLHIIELQPKQINAHPKNNVTVQAQVIYSSPQGQI